MLTERGTATGGQSGQVVEVPTDANGRASIDVSPTGGSGSTSRIKVQIIRPERFAGSDMPRLVIANGTSTIHWTDGGTSYLPEPDDLGSTPIPSLPPTPAPPAVTQRPVLEMEIRGETQTQVGGQARFEVTIRNQGNATATGVVLNDRFDAGLSHPMDSQRSLEIENKNIGDIAPGTSRTTILNFNVLKSGKLCHDATVTCRECAPTQKRACINAIEPPPQANPAIEIRKNGPEVKEVGQQALFSLTLKNSGDVPLTNIQVVDEYDQALLPTPQRQDYKKVGNSIVWNIPRIGVGETVRMDVNCQCLAPNANACNTVQVTADTGTTVGAIQSADTKCIEIWPASSPNVVPPNNVVPPTSNVLPPGPAGAGGLDFSLRLLSNSQLRVGTNAKYEIVVNNDSVLPVDQVQLRLVFPAGIVPDAARASVNNNANVQARLVGNELQYETIRLFRPEERFTFVVEANVTQLGIGKTTALLSSSKHVQPLEKSVQVEVIR